MIIIKINYASTLPNVNITYDQSNIYAKVVYGDGGGGTATWGLINGTLSDQTDLQNALNAKQDDITLTTIGSSGAATFIGATLNIPQYSGNPGTVTSVDMSVPTGLTISGNPITSSGTLAVGLQSGYSIPTTANQANWTTAYNDSITSAAVTGTSTKTLTLNQQDGGTVTASWSDIDTGLTSVGLSMPVAFSVANTPLTANGTLAVSAIGTASQYIRGDGQLATFPSGASGGSSVNYYLNGSVNQGTIGGSVYYEMNRNAVIGAGTDFIRTNLQGNGLIAQFITDANDPNRLEIPGGAWNFEMYFNSSSSGGTPGFYVELLKYDGSTFTSIANNSTNPEGITGGTSTDLYLTSLAVPQTTLLTTDRLAIRVYVITSGKDITLHTEDNNLCQIITTFAGGIAALNGLTANTQYLAVGTSGTDFAISSVSDTHTFNLPTASATNRGALSSTDWTTFNNKQNALTNPITGTGTSGQVAYWSGTNTQTGSATFLFTPTSELDLANSVTAATAIARGARVRPTLVASANNDVLVGLDINPTFTVGAFTGVQNVAIQIPSNGNIKANGFNGSYNINLNTNSSTINGGSGGINFQIFTGNQGRFFSTGNLLLQNGGTFTDGGQRLQVTGTSYFSDSVGIGSTSLTQYVLRVSKNITGSIQMFGITSNGQIQTDVTTEALLYYSVSNQAAGGTLTNLVHYSASQGTISGSVTNQTGFSVGGFTAGTSTNIAFSGNIASGTGRWNLYMGGTANNYMNGNLLLGSTTNSGEKLQVTGTMKVTGASSFGGNMTLSLNQNASTNISITNTTTGTAAQSVLLFYTNAGAGGGIGKTSTGFTPYKTNAAGDTYIYNSVNGDISLLNDFASGNIKFAAGGSSTAQLTIASTGKVLYAAATTAKAQINLASGTAPTSPVDGDIWFDGTDIKMRIGGVTKTFTLI
jgi:hypothetical protein